MPLKFDILNETFECPVCGHPNHISAKNCERCKTIFPDKKPLGGNMELSVEIKDTEEKKNVRKLIRSLPDNYKRERKPRTRDEVLRDFQTVPGITKEIAIKLYDVSGIHSLSDLIYSMLSNQQIKAPERTAIVFEEYILVKKAGGKTISCPFCKTKIEVTSDRCPVCDASVEDEILRLEYEKVTEGLEKFVNEVIQELKFEEEGEKKEIGGEPEVKSDEKPVQAEQKVEEKKKEEQTIKLSLDDLEMLETPVEKKKVEIPEVAEEKKIKLDVEEIETTVEEKTKSLDAVLDGLIEEEKIKKEEDIEKVDKKQKISEEKYKEYKKRIEDWKAEGYDVTEIEKILQEKPEEFDALSKKIIIEQFKRRRAAFKKTVKK